jgi:hypothetical protein
MDIHGGQRQNRTQFCGVGKTVSKALKEIPMKTNHLLMAITFTSVVMLGTSVYAQQDVDPTWYNPWDAPAKVTTQSQPLQFTNHSNQFRAASALSRLQPEKPGGKNPLAGKQVQPHPVRSTLSGKAAMRKKEGLEADSRRRQGKRAAQVASGSYPESIEE